MRILIAEVDTDTVLSYKKALEKRNHQITSTGKDEDLIKIYQEEFKKATSNAAPTELIQPFDAVVLDHKMPEIDSIYAAEQILLLNPHQRIILVSDKEEVSVDSINELTEALELQQKPFREDSLIDTVEDKEIYSELEKLHVNIKAIKNANFRHEQLRHLVDIFKKKGGTCVTN
jgi:CheY-like chemotaxis protein